ncbi:3-hydroxyacyl-ACP dehydratase FabZ family protein [Pelosinus baikalensis]|uniref:Beta-hydroxyacyl-ACP dehydratase n=1 Tax=Pelosinus baikalensis TaxID=2892015 RepID=A0ABS8HWI0_9FIRM|nr:hypothetical protein [Pelosinus baikalensis]MCC5466502.1 hypothetical protein [Pelosinus baikalensis]
MLSFNEICKILEQKAPFVLVDKVLEIDKGKRIVAVKNVSGGELFSALHFPGNSVYPGILILESIAQTASILFSDSIDKDISTENQFLALGGIQRFQFLKVVRPGDTLIIEVEIIKGTLQMALTKVSVKMGDTIIGEGQMSFGVVKDGK